MDKTLPEDRRCWLGVPARRINEIVHGKRRITADTALRLAHYFGMSADIGDVPMVRRKRVTGSTIGQPLLMVSVLVVILFTPLIGTGATSAVNRAFLDAAFNGDTKGVKTLLAEGAEVNVKDTIGFTALFGAARSGHTETVKLLLAKGADPNVKLPTSGTTALMYAALNGHNDIVVALLDKGAEVNARNKRGITSLMYAAYGGRIQVAQTLLAKGAEINVRDNEGLTALGYAETTHHDEVGQILKKAGAK